MRMSILVFAFWMLIFSSSLKEDQHFSILVGSRSAGS